MANPILTSDILKDDGAITKTIEQLEILEREIISKKKRIEKEAIDLGKSLKNFNPATVAGQGGIKKAASNLSQIAAETKKLNALQDDSRVKIQGLKNAQAELTKIKKLEAQILKSEVGSIKNLSAELKLNKLRYDELTEAQRKNSNEGRRLASEIARGTTKLKQLKKEQADAVRVRQLEDKFNKSAIGSYDRLSAQYSLMKIRLNAMSDAERQNTKAGRALEAQSKRIYTEMDRLQKATGKATLSVGNYRQALAGLGRRALGALGITGGIALVANTLRSAAGAAREFEVSLSKLSSITGLTDDDGSLTNLADKAREISSLYGTAGKDVLDAFGLIGSKNPELLQNAEALAEVTKQAEILSKAAGIDLPQAGEALAGFLNIYSADASEAARFTDILATSQQKGTARIEQLAQSFQNVGAALATNNISFEKGNALLQALAKGGEEGSNAGIKLRNILISLAKTGREDLNPATQDINDILNILSKEVTTVTDATDLFESANATAALTLIKNRDIVQELSGALDEQGNALSQANTNTDNLDGSLKRLSERWTAFTSQLFSSESRIGKLFKNAVDTLDEFIERVQILDKQESTVGVGARDRVGQALEARGESRFTQLKRYLLSGADLTDLIKIYDEQLEDALKEFRGLSKRQLSFKFDEIVNAFSLAGYGEKAKEAAQKFIDGLTPAKKDIDNATDSLDELGDSANEAGDKIDKSTKNVEEAATGLTKLKKELSELNKEYKSLDISDLEAIEVKAGEIINKEKEIENYQIVLDSIKNRVGDDFSEIAPLGVLNFNPESIGNQAEDERKFKEQQEYEKSVFDLSKKTDIEKKQFAITQEIEKLNFLLSLNKKYNNELSTTQIDTINNQIEALKSEFDALGNEEGGAKDIFDLLGLTVDDKKKQAITDAFNFAKQQVLDFGKARTEAANQSVQDANTEVQSAENQLQREISNRNAGYAHKVQTANKELAAAKENQKKALEERRKAQLAEIKLQAALQASNLVLASTKIWRSLGFPAAIPAIGVMWGSFLASKIRAAQLTKREFAKGGLEIIGGGTHASGNDTFIGMTNDGKAGYAERGEARMILSRKATKANKEILPTVFRALNTGKFEKYFTLNNQVSGAHEVFNYANYTDLTKAENELTRIRKQGETQVQYLPDGSVVKRYKNLTKRTHFG